MKIEINAKFGSKFQEKSARDALRAMLESWKRFYELSHKKNRIQIVDVIETKEPLK